MMNRREFLGSGSAAAALAALGFPDRAFAAWEIKLGAETSFSFDALIERARSLAAKPYEVPPPPPRDILERINYQAHGQIKFDTNRALFADGPGPFPVTSSISASIFRHRCACMS